jgi:glucosamine--fructose-6-phosphate aminotransferase (isomerizing)
MCGVIGYIGKKPCADFIFEGLKKLEYRGYDSAGIAILSENHTLHLIKSEGKLDKLKPLLSELPRLGSIGMGHTRWATHGIPSTENAHPHVHQGLAIIHNGILENYKELKTELRDQGDVFKSETDSEVFVHILNREMKEVTDIKQAILNLIPRFRGAFALAILSEKEPDAIYIVKQGSPLVVGLGEGENYFASDALALGTKTHQFLFLEDGEFARVDKDHVDVWNFEGTPIKKIPTHLEWTQSQVEKLGHPHYMLKEIYEQPAVAANIIDRFYDPIRRDISFAKHDLTKIDFMAFDRIEITGCGTAFYAGHIGKYILEPILKVPVNIELASELRYRNPYMNEKTLLIAVTQSGETADTLACVKLAKSKGAQILSICNVRYSSIARESTSVLYMEAGAEIGVASTKAFSAMILNLYFFALAAAQKRGCIDRAQIQTAIENVLKVPTLIDQALSRDKHIATVAHKYFELTSTLFVGRGPNYPLALEGALKLKEISYIHAEGYAGGELKHGPIALIDRNMAVVSIVAKDSYREKMISNLEEIRAREGKIIGIGPSHDETYRTLCEDYIPCPQIDDEGLQVLISVIPLQLFAYNVAVLRGTDVDQPRNLAKSVTVE